MAVKIVYWWDVLNNVNNVSCCVESILQFVVALLLIKYTSFTSCTCVIHVMSGSDDSRAVFAVTGIFRCGWQYDADSARLFPRPMR